MKSICTILLLCLLLAAHAARSEEVTLRIDGLSIRAEVADTPERRAQGLMHRQQLCANCGMVFVFKQPDRHSFWMKDTPMPLSIAFISADGGIINIDEMQPNTTDIHNAQGDALYALEMNSGWFSANRIGAHDRVQGLERLSGTDR
jgi:uncharacterized membrane protein (UPF0127 family)